MVNRPRRGNSGRWQTTATPPRTRDFVVPLLVVCFVLLALAFSSIPWFGLDWRNFYQRGALSSMPYELSKVVAPPWTYWMLRPVAALGDDLGLGVLTLATMLICLLYVRDPRKFGVLCLSIPFQAAIVLGQPDALVLVGLMVPAELSLLFLTMKPQGAALAALKDRRLTARSVGILLGVFAGSLVIYGLWPSAWAEPPTWGSNWSVWPASMIIGVSILVQQRQRGFDSDAMLCLASLMISPYFCITSLLPVTAAAVKELDQRHSLVLLVIVPWLYVAVTGIGWSGPG